MRPPTHPATTPLLVLVATLLAPAPVAAQRLVTGRVEGGGRPLAQARVAVARQETRTDAEGRFRLVVTDTSARLLVVRAVGFQPLDSALAVARGAGGDSLHVVVRLARAAAALEPVVTTGTLRATLLSDSPVKVEVVSERLLRRSVTNNLVDAVRVVNGLAAQVDCGVCFTSSLRINGMEGPYTAVLVDGAPMMSALAAVYGLSGISPAVIAQVEVIKGPASTLYGTEAMGGVVNVVTKDPRFAPRLTVDAHATTHGERTLEVSAAPAVGGARVLLSGSLAHNGRFVDANGDRFSDLPLLSRVALFGKWAAAPGGRGLEASARYYYEDRFGGRAEWTPAHRGSGTVYGESIYTSRWELTGSWRPAAAGGEATRVDFAANWHDQDSWYGAERFAARQGVVFAQAVWDRRVGERHALLLGGGARLQHYDDDTPATARADRRLIPGLFAQDEIALGDAVTLLGGVRLDHHRDHGAIVSPRVNVKWAPAEETTVRLNAATGFRVVNLFTEDHRALTGARRVVIAEALQPERSLSAAVNVNHHVHLGGREEDVVVLDADLFVTHFTNRIHPDYASDPDAIVYANLDGHARTQGVSLSAAFDAPARPYALTAGVTLQDVTVTERGVRRRLEFAPRVSGVWTASWRAARGALTLDWTGRVVGPQRLPAVAGQPARSPWFTEQHVQATHALRPGLEVYAAVKNVFGFRQADPILRPDDPFGPEFDTVRVYGPTQGRRVLAGLRYGVGRE